MMVDKVEMSLDDIIKQNKQFKYPSKRGRGGNAGGGQKSPFQRRAGNKPAVRAGGIQKRKNQNVSRVKVPAFLRVIRGSHGGSEIRKRLSCAGRRLLNCITSINRGGGDINGRWQHDLFDNSFGRRGGLTTAGGTTKLLVGNLDYGVSNTDIQELFTEFGPLKSATVHYDKSGRSLGTAEVVYERKGDAVKAMKQYNGVPLDGRPMNIQLTTSEIPMRKAPVKVINKMTPKRGQMTGRGRGIKRGGGAGRGGRRPGNKPMTAEQLDAELDAYVNKVK